MKMGYTLMDDILLVHTPPYLMLKKERVRVASDKEIENVLKETLSELAIYQENSRFKWFKVGEPKDDIQEVVILIYNHRQLEKEIDENYKYTLSSLLAVAEYAADENENYIATVADDDGGLTVFVKDGIIDSIVYLSDIDLTRNYTSWFPQANDIDRHYLFIAPGSMIGTKIIKDHNTVEITIDELRDFIKNNIKNLKPYLDKSASLLRFYADLHKIIIYGVTIIIVGAIGFGLFSIADNQKTYLQEQIKQQQKLAQQLQTEISQQQVANQQELEQKTKLIKQLSFVLHPPRRYYKFLDITYDIAQKTKGNILSIEPIDKFFVITMTFNSVNDAQRALELLKSNDKYIKIYYNNINKVMSQENKSLFYLTVEVVIK